jgi:hypothetical protein
MMWEGVVEDGMGIASSRLVWPERGWAPGTLNLRGERLDHKIRWGNPEGWAIKWWMPIVAPAIFIARGESEPVMIGVNTADNTVEVACRHHLRTKYWLQNGDRVTLHIDDEYVVQEGEEDAVNKEPSGPSAC